MIEKYRKQILIFFISFIIYFAIGLIVTYQLNTYDTWNVMFEMDTPRVIGDLTLLNYDHHRASVHPLFIIIFQPIVLFINLLIRNQIICILLIQSILSSLTLTLLYSSICKICKNQNTSLLLTILFGTSFPQIVYTTAIETYIFAQFFLIILWVFAFNKCDRKFNYWDYIIFILLGIGSLAITITNFIQYIIIVFFIFTLNEKNKHSVSKTIFIILTVISFSVLLAEIQNLIWPTAPNFFTKIITDFIYNTSEERYYLSKNISFNNFLNVINSNYAQSYNIFSLIIPQKETNITFSQSIITSSFSIICFISFVIINVKFIKKNINKLWEHKLYFSLLISYLFNVALHIFYGNNMTFLYICHYNFILLYLIIYVLNNILHTKNVNNKVMYIILISIITLFIRTIIILFNKLFEIYKLVNKVEVTSIIIILIVLLILFKFIKKIISESKNEKVFRTNKN